MANKNLYIESDAIFEIYRECKETKANHDAYHVTVYVIRFSTLVIMDFYMLLYH